MTTTEKTRKKDLPWTQDKWDGLYPEGIQPSQLIPVLRDLFVQHPARVYSIKELRAYCRSWGGRLYLQSDTTIGLNGKTKVWDHKVAYAVSILKRWQAIQQPAYAKYQLKGREIPF